MAGISVSDCECVRSTGRAFPRPGTHVLLELCVAQIIMEPSRLKTNLKWKREET
jgi:hypothetical protein